LDGCQLCSSRDSTKKSIRLSNRWFDRVSLPHYRRMTGCVIGRIISITFVKFDMIRSLVHLALVLLNFIDKFGVGVLARR